MKTAKTRNFLKITAGLTLALLLWKNTGRVKSVYIECHKTKGEQLALQLLIESFEITQYFQRQYYEAHVQSDSGYCVINYYPHKEVLCLSLDPCSGWGGQIILAGDELLALKNQNKDFESLRLTSKKPPLGYVDDVPNSLCDSFSMLISFLFYWCCQG